jgi:hypothetical protein
MQVDLTECTEIDIPLGSLKIDFSMNLSNYSER